jgi:tetratricopeptide (TPR) repeat protein
MTRAEELGRRYYRLGLGAAQRRDLSAALAYAYFACILDPEHAGAIRLAEICRIELGEAGETREAELERIVLLAGQKKWKAAAQAAKSVAHQSVWFLGIQGCLWALAKRYASAMDCFAKALGKDRGNAFAAEALAELGRRRKFLGGLFVSL